MAGHVGMPQQRFNSAFCPLARLAAVSVLLLVFVCLALLAGLPSLVLLPCLLRDVFGFALARICDSAWVAVLDR